MKDNISIGSDVMNWYCCMVELKVCQETVLNGSRIGCWGNDEFCHHFKLMKDIHSAQFNEYVKQHIYSARRVHYVKTTMVADMFQPFVETLYDSWKKANEYRESRPDLYD